MDLQTQYAGCFDKPCDLGVVPAVEVQRIAIEHAEDLFLLPFVVFPIRKVRVAYRTRKCGEESNARM
jgi:hypothetical protein